MLEIAFLDHHKWYQSLDLASLCMRPTVHYYYTKSNTWREMASVRKSERSHNEEAPERAIHEEDRRPWMNELPDERTIKGEGEA